MKEHSLIMSPQMIHATHAGRKTQTRRIPGPTNSLVDGRRVSARTWNDYDWDLKEYWIDPGPSPAGNSGPYFKFRSRKHDTIHRIYPIYEAGDLLYFRENWFPAAINGNRVLIAYDKDKPQESLEITVGDTGPYWKKMERGGVIPSIHLPKEASRIWAECTGVSCQHLQDITEEEAKREGCAAEWVKGPNTPDGPGELEGYSAVDDFASLWIELHSKDSWASNPAVYAISYKILSTSGRPLEEDPDRDKTYQEESKWL